MSPEILTIDPAIAPLDLSTGGDGFLLRDFKSPPPKRKIILATSQDTEGDILVDSEYDSRTITALIRAKAEVDRPTWYAKLERLQEKIAKINEQGGVLQRTLLGASTNGYFDLIGDAEADIPWDVVRYGKAMDVDITLNFLAKPFIRGDEIPLSLHSEVTLPCLVFTEVNIRGDVTGIGRLQFRNDSSVDQLIAWWGIQCRTYSSSSRAALFYEAENLTLLDQAAIFTLAGTSGAGTNNCVRHSSPNTSTWTPILGTDIAGAGKMLHQGTYRVLARTYSTFTGPKPQIRLLYGWGDLTKTTTLSTLTFQTTASFFIMDFGLVRLGNSPQWGGAFQGLAGTAGDTIIIDCVMLIPVDEGFGFAKAIQPPSNLIGLNSIRPASTGAADTTVGQIGWSNSGNSAVEDGSYATTTLAGEINNNPTTAVTSNPNPAGFNEPYAWANPSLGLGASSGTSYASCTWDPVNGGISQSLQYSNLGFAIPTGATITGIKVIASVYGQTDNATIIDTINLYKAGTILPSASLHTSGANYAHRWTGWSLRSWGGAGDLWGTTWTPADINNAGFGCAIGCGPAGPTFSGAMAAVDYAQMVVYYSIETNYLKTTGYGFTLPSTAVITGISVSLKRFNSSPGTIRPLQEHRVQLVKAGVIQATNRATDAAVETVNTWKSYGGANDLWGGTWLYTDINSSTFGVVVSYNEIGSSADNNGSAWAQANVDAMKITVFYTTGGGFQATADSVMFANGRVLEVNDHEVKRQSLDGTFYVPAAYYTGSYLRVPTAQQELRTMRVFAKTSRASDPTVIADSAIDDISGQLLYTPRYLMHPDS